MGCTSFRPYPLLHLLDCREFCTWSTSSCPALGACSAASLPLLNPLLQLLSCSSVSLTYLCSLRTQPALLVTQFWQRWVPVGPAGAVLFTGALLGAAGLCSHRPSWLSPDYISLIKKFLVKVGIEACNGSKSNSLHLLSQIMKIKQVSYLDIKGKFHFYCTILYLLSLSNSS